MKKSEKIISEKIRRSAQALQKEQRGLGIGHLIALFRGQLSMSQRALAKRAHVPQSTISKIESGSLKPNISTLEKILAAMQCDLLITAVPHESLEVIKQHQAAVKAKKKIEYIQGTMNLEQQEPSKDFLQELLDDETKKLLESPNPSFWEEDL